MRMRGMVPVVCWISVQGCGAGGGGSVPPPPADLAATAGNTLASLTWQVAENASSYEIRRATTAGGPYERVGSTLDDTFVDSGLANGTTYCYVVAAVNAGGTSAFSNEASATPSPGAAPLAPGDLQATAGDGKVVLTWGAAADTLWYVIERGEAAGGPYETIGSTADLSFTDADVSNGTTYYYVVAAVNAGGTSAPSNEASATPSAGAAPLAPADLQATAGDGKVVLTWGAAADTLWYVIERGEAAGGPYETIGSTADLSFTDADVSNGTTYYYVVAAVNAGGTSAPSNEASANPTPALPDVPAGLVATAGDGRVDLSWDTGPRAAAYRVKRGTASGGPYDDLAITTEPLFTDSRVWNHRDYYYVVTGVSPGGEGPRSDEAHARPMPAVTELCVADGVRQQVLAFTLPTGEGTMDQAPTRVFGNLTQLLWPQAIAIDLSRNELFVANGGWPVRIQVFDLDTADGNVAPVRTFTHPDLSMSWPVQAMAVDETSGRLFVAVYGRLFGFARDATGEATPLSDITGASTTLQTAGTVDLEIDAVHQEILVASGNFVRVFDLNATGDVSPLFSYSTGAAVGVGYEATTDRVLVVRQGGGQNFLAFNRGVDTPVATAAVPGEPASDLVLYGTSAILAARGTSGTVLWTWTGSGGSGFYIDDVGTRIQIARSAGEIWLANEATPRLTARDPEANWSVTRAIGGDVHHPNVTAAWQMAYDADRDELLVVDRTAVAAFARGSGDLEPTRVLRGWGTGLVAPESVAVELGRRRVWVASQTGVSAFSADFDGPEAPLLSITDSRMPLALAVDEPNQELWVAYSGYAIYSLSAFRLEDGVLLRTVEGLDSPYALAVDPTAGEVYVAGCGNEPGVEVYERLAEGDAEPVRQITGAQSGMDCAQGLALLGDRLYTTSMNNVVSSVLVHDRTADGDVPPILTLSGPQTGLYSAYGITVCN